jgi:hypothetical protein
LFHAVDADRLVRSLNQIHSEALPPIQPKAIASNECAIAMKWAVVALGAARSSDHLDVVELD